ncbi:MAG: arsenic resistance N-acetyltransferase ArsN2 [Caldilinea sp.]|nr:arsenic resistance N-acetyltransferase ArsN2 [Caldilinea sp.]MDW8439260.1 arsenic resistance N-acetyltransferase ArsN2 [Caldilineaceae bacterium]
MNDLLFRTATPADWPAIVNLLRRYDLPTEGAQAHLDAFIVAVNAENELKGVAGLERYGKVGLLRSLAVAEQGWGIGAALVERILELARSLGMQQVVLLTTTAADYFLRFGFQRIARSAAPAAAHTSAEFQGACPASATVMLLRL